MAVIDRAFRAKALSLNDDLVVTHGSAIPSDAPGVEAPVGSIYLCSSDEFVYTKFGTADTDWRKLITLEEMIRQHSSYNGLLRNGFGTLDDNSNFSQLTYDWVGKIKDFEVGNFYHTGHFATIQSNDFIPVRIQQVRFLGEEV